MKRHIPNALTLFNLFCGCCATVSALHTQWLDVAMWVLLGFFADALDGQTARWLGVSSPLGKELDSMADMVTFAVTPGMILYMFLVNASGGNEGANLNYAALPAFLVSVFGGFRLAKYNIDTRQSETFIGLATPASTTFVVGLMLMYHYDYWGAKEVLSNVYVLYGVIAFLSYIQNAEIPMFNFRFKGFGWVGNELRYVFIALLIVTLIAVPKAFLMLGIVFYILFSIIHNLIKASPNPSKGGEF
jgi:CDP-diacylglycerol---serine O-phosphatidyltransferase